jgi:hypothetical protein
VLGVLLNRLVGEREVYGYGTYGDVATGDADSGPRSAALGRTPAAAGRPRS